MTDQHQASMVDRYRRAEKIEQGAFSKTIAFNTTLYPHWIGDSDNFWYIRETREGQSFRLVDAKAGSNGEAFDHGQLAQALSAASGETVAADNLPLSELDLTQAPDRVIFSAFDQRWVFASQDQQCQAIESCPAGWRPSPDGSKAVFVRDYNLWQKDLLSGEEKALTTDGQRLYAYGAPTTAYGRTEAPEVEVIWSPDSTRILSHVIDTRQVNVGPPIVEHVPADGSLRPRIIAGDRRVAFPEDEHIELSQILCIELSSGAIQTSDWSPHPFIYPPYKGLASGHRGWWASDSQTAYFVTVDRGGKAGRLLAFDTDSGKTQPVIEEFSDTLVSFIPISHMGTLIMPLPETREVVWYSQRDGYAHLYLYDLATGELKHPITSGQWVVRNVLHLDPTRRELWIQTAGRAAGRNPYYCDICRVNIDTGELTELLSTDDEYICLDQRSRISASRPNAKAVSPSANFIVTTGSRVDKTPFSLLLDREGNTVTNLETADISGLPANWQWPEPIQVKAADGETDIWGVIFRPTDFSADKTYPVLDCSYGYADPTGAFTNNHVNSWMYFSPAAYAELGFIVVVLHNRGNSGLRDSAFNHYQDPVMPLHPMLQARAHKADCVEGIKQLAERYPYMDLSRVGVTEFGSVPMALAGLLLYPDFYTVGVSNNPQADWRLAGAFGSDLGDYPSFEDFADQLQGKLLFIVGMLEDVKPIAMTLRVVEALRREDKSFDMLMVPNLGHASTSYEIRRSWDYFVEHLLHETPPKDFKLVTSFE